MGFQWSTTSWPRQQIGLVDVLIPSRSLNKVHWTLIHGFSLPSMSGSSSGSSSGVFRNSFQPLFTTPLRYDQIKSWTNLLLSPPNPSDSLISLTSFDCTCQICWTDVRKGKNRRHTEIDCDQVQSKHIPKDYDWKIISGSAPFRDWRGVFHGMSWGTPRFNSQTSNSATRPHPCIVRNILWIAIKTQAPYLSSSLSDAESLEHNAVPVLFTISIPCCSRDCATMTKYPFAVSSIQHCLARWVNANNSFISRRSQLSINRFTGSDGSSCRCEWIF
jgi:hypothetical protein